MHLNVKCIQIFVFWFMLWLAVVVSSGNNAVGLEVCPKYCRCYMWHLPNGTIRRADCINRKLVNIETEVPQSVQAIDLSNNSIAVLENNGFKNLGYLQLKYLNLKFNKISSIGLNTFAGLNDLEIVDLSNNHLNYLLAGTFYNTPVIRVLYLSHNKLEMHTSGSFLDIPSLNELDISHCQLSNINVDYFSQLPSLKKLNLSDNQLIRLDARTLYPLKSVREVDLSKNPWSCDGITTELQQWLQKQLIRDTTTCIKEEDKFAKIINAIVDTGSNQTQMESLDEDISHFWFNTDDKENGKDESNRIATQNYDNHSQSLYNILERIPSVWAMMIGFQVGVVITVFGMYIWLQDITTFKVQPLHFRRPRSLRLASHSNEMLWTQLESDMPNCPDTPPPPYHPYRSTTHEL